MTPAEMAARIEVLERHRDQWRRIAWRLYGELKTHDAAKADEIVDDTPTDTTSKETP